jgi:ArsR family transcriptional regulator
MLRAATDKTPGAASGDAPDTGASGTAVCGPTSLAQPLNRPDAESLSKVLKALADPTRLQLVSLIKSAPQGEACVCDLTAPLGLRQPTVSHHLKVLVDAGLLQREKRATWVWYSLVPQAWSALHASLR